MSTGLFMGVRQSYIEEAQPLARKFIQAMNRALAKNGIPVYVEPYTPPNVYNGNLFGRSELDNHTSRVLAEVAGIAASLSPSPHLALIRDNPYRVSFVPADFDSPFQTDYSEQISGTAIPIHVGSLPQLLAELKTLAQVLGIPLNEGELSDRDASAINAWRPLHDGDTAELIEDERTAWLLLYEGTRLAIHHNIALTLAG
jgi:hypothetical protein